MNTGIRSLVQPGRSGATVGYFAAYITLGMSSAILGPTLPGLAGQTSVSLSQISLLFPAHSLGYLLGSFLSGRLYDRISGHPLMAAALCLLAILLAGVPLAPVLWLLFLAVLIAGMAGGAVDVGGNTLIVWAYGSSVGPYMNALHFFFGVGALLAPILVAQAFALTDRFAGAYWVLALVALPISLWISRMPSPSQDARHNPLPGETASASGAKHAVDGRILVLLVAVLLGLYIGAEASFGGWIFTYALALNLADATTAAYLTSIFWGALTVGRFLSIPIALRFRPRTILLVDLVGCVISLLALLLGSESWMVTWLGAAGVGLFMASIFPTAISWTGQRVPITGQITGAFLVAASLGGMSLPWIIGQLFEPVGPQVAILAILAALIGATVVFGVLVYYSERKLAAIPSKLG